MFLLIGVALGVLESTFLVLDFITLFVTVSFFNTDTTFSVLDFIKLLFAISFFELEKPLALKYNQMQCMAKV